MDSLGVDLFPQLGGLACTRGIGPGEHRSDRPARLIQARDAVQEARDTAGDDLGRERSSDAHHLVEGFSDQVQKGPMREPNGAARIHVPGIENLHRTALERSPQAIMEGGPD